jgi:hypothetical protein
MSTAAGYVYILFNSAMRDLVKIGQTAGSPEERAKELSNPTGVPLPFTVAWQAELLCYKEAELEIHSRLAQFRANKRREFFAIPLKQAIQVAGQVAEEFNQQAARQLDSFDDVGQDVGDFLQAYKARKIEHFLKARVEQRFGRWEKAAQAGFGPSQHLYGTCLSRGIGISQDQVEAVRWFRKAAETGYVPAYTSLGSMYSRGFGVPKDEAQAVSWFRKAAEKGYALAQLLLGIMFEQGTGVPKDENAAVGWYSKAAQQGLDEAEKALQRFRVGSKPRGAQNNAARGVLAS